MESANEEQRRALVYDEGWNLCDLVSHLASAEKENVRFLREVLAQDGARHRTEPRVSSLDDWNAQAVGQRKAHTWDERLAELHTARRITLDTLATITPERFAHKGTHAVWGEKTIEGLLKILYLHDILHRNDVARKLRGG